MERTLITAEGNYVSISLLPEDAKFGYHRGPCDEDIELLSKIPYIKVQLEQLDLQSLVKELKEFWNVEELADNRINCLRFLWLACADIVENDDDETPLDL